MKKKKRETTEGIEQPSQKSIRTLWENENYKHLRILETDNIKLSEIKEKVRKEFHKRTRKLLETKLCKRNLIKGMNTWAILFVRYTGPFFKWTR